MSQSKLPVTVEKMELLDKIAVNWTIPNFKALYDTSKAAKLNWLAKEKFTVGGNSWTFYIGYFNDEMVRLSLCFDGTECVSAEYAVLLKFSEGKFINTLNSNAEVQKYAPNIANIQGAAAYCTKEWTSMSALQNEGFLSDGNLQLRLIVSVYSENALLKMRASKDLKNGLDSALGSDITFIFVEEEDSQNVIGEIKAHKAILSLRSSVFATMFGSGMTEATDGEVKISDISPKAMKILLSFIYSGEVDSEWGFVAEELIYGADKYNLPGLQKYLCKNVDPVLTVKNVMKIRNLATLYNLPDVLKSTLKFISENTQGFLDNHQVIFMDIP